MKYILFLATLVCSSLINSFSQSFNIECTMLKRGEDIITLTPAHFDVAALPKLGQQVMIFIYVKDDLPAEKNAGYFDLCWGEVSKLSIDNKTITLKTTYSLEDRKIELGLPQLNLLPGSRMKISWKN